MGEEGGRGGRKRKKEEERKRGSGQRGRMEEGVWYFETLLNKLLADGGLPVLVFIGFCPEGSKTKNFKNFKLLKKKIKERLAHIHSISAIKTFERTSCKVAVPSRCVRPYA